MDSQSLSKPSESEDVQATGRDKRDSASADEDRMVSRRFTVEYKLRLLREVDQSNSEEEVNAILVRETLTRSLVARWRAEMANGDLSIASAQHGIKSGYDLIRSEDRGVETRSVVAYPSAGFVRSGATETSQEELLSRIWGGRWAILTITVLVIAATLCALLVITPMYSAKGLIVIESGQQTIAGIQPVITGVTTDQKVETQIEILRSPDLANKTIENLNLRSNEEFNATLRPKNLLVRVSEVIGHWFASRDAVLTEQRRQQIAQTSVVDEFLDHLKVASEGRSRVVAVTFKSRDPELAAKVVNVLMEVYIAQQSETKFKNVHHANDWLSERLSSLKTKVEVAETAVEKFREKLGLFQSGEGTPLRSQEIAELNTQLTLASAARFEAEARLRQVSTLVSQADGFESAPEVLQSELVRRLREQEALLERKAAELSTEYGPKHPRMVNIQAEKKDLQAKIATEVSKIVKGLKNEVAVARARETALQSSVDSLKQQIATDNEASVRLRALEREAAAQRTLLETFLGRFNETSIQRDTDIQPPEAHVASLALVPIKPVPDKKKILLLSLVASVLLGIAFVFGLLHRGFWTGEEVESETGVPVLGFIPKLSPMAGFRAPAERYFARCPLSAFSEAIRSINTAVRLAGKGELPKKLLITSALPKEGKTVIALSLARSRVLGGYKVVLVSADVRWPTVESAFNLPNSPGLCEYLEGKVSVDEIIKKDEATGVHVVPAGRWESMDIAELFDTDLMDRLLGDLARRYDSVLIDSPPVMAVSEARVLANKVDMALFVVRWATTRKATVRQALRQIVQSTSSIGVVMSMVGVTQHGRMNTYYRSYGYRKLG
ncbi:MAG: GumC family protein, partial [Gammaproteobacteria bacterium]